jgi:ubiquinol-cytochrome c reductase cytochrome b subunit
VIRRLARALDRRTGSGGAAGRALRYVFPDHWSFMLGEIALYAFVVLVATGVYLALFFTPSLAETTYAGGYAPLHGARVTEAFASTVHLSLDVRAGLLIRQTHHWAALVFVVAIVIHMLRVFFTGAFRRPREPIWVIGVALLALALLEGYAGYSLPDDLLSGMGLAIGYSVLTSVPIVGAQLAFLVWGGEFPGAATFVDRLYIAHVFVLPIVIAALIGLHLLLIARVHHTQFPGPRRREDNVVGTRMWPGYALRSSSLFLSVAAVLVLLGGLVQINPIWLWGPYEVGLSTNGAQPDWYLGWLIGALRIMPPVEIHVFGLTLVPNPFFGGVLFPTVVIGTLLLWPWIERRVSGDTAAHHLLDRPRDAPGRTAAGAALAAWVAVIFIAGSTDRLVWLPYTGQVWFFRAAAVVAPVAAFVVTRRMCRDLSAAGVRPLRGYSGARVRRTAAGGYEAVPGDGGSDPMD